MRLTHNKQITYHNRLINPDIVFDEELDYINVNNYDGLLADMIYETSSERREILPLTVLDLVEPSFRTMLITSKTDTSDKVYIAAGDVLDSDVNLYSSGTTNTQFTTDLQASIAASRVMSKISSTSTADIQSVKNLSLLASGKGAVEYNGSTYEATSTIVQEEYELRIDNPGIKLYQGPNEIVFPYTTTVSRNVHKVTLGDLYKGDGVLPTYVEDRGHYFYVIGSKRLSSGRYKLSLIEDVFVSSPGLLEEPILLSSASYSLDGSVERFIELYSPTPPQLNLDTLIYPIQGPKYTVVPYLAKDDDITTWTTTGNKTPKYKLLQQDIDIMSTTNSLYDRRLGLPLPFHISFYDLNGTFQYAAKYQVYPTSGGRLACEVPDNIIEYSEPPTCVKVFIDNISPKVTAYAFLVADQITKYLAAEDYTVFVSTDHTISIKSGEVCTTPDDKVKQVRITRSKAATLDLTQCITSGRVESRHIGEFTFNTESFSSFELLDLITTGQKIELTRTQDEESGVRYKKFSTPPEYMMSLDINQTQSTKGKVLDVAVVYDLTPQDNNPVVYFNVDILIGSTKNVQLFLADSALSRIVEVQKSNVVNGHLVLTLKQDARYGTSKIYVQGTTGLVGIFDLRTYSQLSDAGFEELRNNQNIYRAYNNSIAMGTINQSRQAREIAYASQGDIYRAASVTNSQISSVPFGGKMQLGPLVPSNDYLSAAKEDYNYARNLTTKQINNEKQLFANRLSQVNSTPVTPSSSLIGGPTSVDEPLVLIIKRPGIDQRTRSLISTIERHSGYEVNMVSKVSNMSGLFKGTLPFNSRYSRQHYEEACSRLEGGMRFVRKT